MPGSALTPIKLHILFMLVLSLFCFSFGQLSLDGFPWSIPFNFSVVNVLYYQYNIPIFNNCKIRFMNTWTILNPEYPDFDIFPRPGVPIPLISPDYSDYYTYFKLFSIIFNIYFLISENRSIMLNR